MQNGGPHSEAVQCAHARGASKRETERERGRDPVKEGVSSALLSCKKSLRREQ